jgi:hypothetical protein
MQGVDHFTIQKLYLSTEDQQDEHANRQQRCNRLPNQDELTQELFSPVAIHGNIM